VTVFTRMYRGETHFDFVSISKKTLIVSGVLVIASILIMIVKPFNLSIDFTGGVIVSVDDASGASVEDVRTALRDVGYADARVQITGEGAVLVQTEALDPAEQDLLVVTVADVAGATVNEVNVDAVGPTFGAEVTRKAIEALIVFLIAVSLFITWRFEWKMAGAALAALFHDLVIAGGIYALIGFVVTPSTIIAVLTILGYSLYDTVVVFDKVTENVHETTSRTTYSSIINTSMNQVLMRSINTSLTSLLPVGSLLFVGFLAIGAETLLQFALALFIGIAIGTYSSLFVASPLLAMWKEREPEWERRRRRSERVADEPAEAAPAVPVPTDPGSGAPPIARPPKQRRKRR
jgi:preprotein translocase subunit SecF